MFVYSDNNRICSAPPLAARIRSRTASWRRTARKPVPGRARPLDAASLRPLARARSLPSGWSRARLICCLPLKSRQARLVTGSGPLRSARTLCHRVLAVRDHPQIGKPPPLASPSTRCATAISANRSKSCSFACSQPDQNARRLPLGCRANCLGRVWKSAQMRGTAKTTNIVMTAAATSIESVGIAGLLSAELVAWFKEIVFDLNQPAWNFVGRKSSYAAARASTRVKSSSRTPPTTMINSFSRSNRVNVRLTVSIVSPRKSAISCRLIGNAVVC